MTVRVTVIIPVWREGPGLRALLADANLRRADEVIVVGPTDEIDELHDMTAGRARIRVIASRPGRAPQMNAGAAVASGDWLLFLHADSALPDRWIDDIVAADRDPAVVAGAFRFGLDSRDPRARLIEWGVRRRIAWFDLPYGDQGLFVRRNVFRALGGFPDLPLMEDVAFVRQVRTMGALHHSPRTLRTSARRWERDGWIRRTASNWIAVAAYLAGASPRRLARWYANRSADAVVVLARDPRAQGKTRLWHALGIAPDPDLPGALLMDTIASVDGVGSADKVLAHTGQRDAIERYRPTTWSTLAQRGEDLGERMSAAFEDVFARGHARVALVGADLPTLPGEVVRQSLRLLRRDADVVLGPADDGGYFLVALHAPQPQLFSGIDWGTPRVLEQTTRRARELNLRIRLVQGWYDVDDCQTLQRAAADPRAARTKAWVETRLGDAWIDRAESRR